MKITDGLFRNKWEFFKDIKILFDRVKFVWNKGYHPIGQWETDAWFIETMKDILKFQRFERHGTPWLIGKAETSEENVAMNDKIWNDILDEMLMYLEEMDVFTVEYPDALAAKDKFFELFSMYFYNLWD